MRKYLATLHKRSDHHKKNFALGVSGGATLLIFGIWFAVNFGEPSSPQAVTASVNEAGPLESLGEAVSSSWSAVKDSAKVVGEIFDNVDVKSGYEELKSETLEKYGN